MLTRVHINGIPAQYRQLVVAVPNPGTGNDWSYVIPASAGVGYILESASFTLVTNATVATRGLRIQIKRGSTVYGVCSVIGSATAGATFQCQFEKDVVSNSTSQYFVGSMPYLPALPPGDIVESFVSNLQTGGGGDTLSDILLTFSVPQ